MSVRKIAMVGMLSLVIGALVSAAGSDVPFNATRASVPSNQSFEHVVGNLKSLVAKNGMMVMAQVDQGNILSMTGLSLKATLFLVGNPTVGKQVFEQDHAAGLYLPFRISVYADANGKTHVEYDVPSTLLAQFKNPTIDGVAKMLDQKLANLATMAAQ